MLILLFCLHCLFTVPFITPVLCSYTVFIMLLGIFIYSNVLQGWLDAFVFYCTCILFIWILSYYYCICFLLFSVISLARVHFALCKIRPRKKLTNLACTSACYHLPPWHNLPILPHHFPIPAPPHIPSTPFHPRAERGAPVVLPMMHVNEVSGFPAGADKKPFMDVLRQPKPMEYSFH